MYELSAPMIDLVSVVGHIYGVFTREEVEDWPSRIQTAPLRTPPDTVGKSNYSFLLDLKLHSF